VSGERDVDQCPPYSGEREHTYIAAGDGWRQCRQCGHWQAPAAAPAAEADLQDQIAAMIGNWYPQASASDGGALLAECLLAGPLRSLVEQAAEAARLRETVGRVVTEIDQGAPQRVDPYWLLQRIRRALDREAGR
jgi:hypothetical protein